MICYICNIKDNNLNYSICCVCNNTICLFCNHKHNHYYKKLDYMYGKYNIDKNDEINIQEKRITMTEIIKQYKKDYTYKDLYMTYDILREFRIYNTQRHNIKEKIIYEFVKMFLKKRFCNDIISIILMYL